MKDTKICIIGGGNLGSSLALGLGNHTAIEPANITITRRSLNRIQYLADQGFQISSDNNASVSNADIVFLVVKPYQVAGILEDIKESLAKTKPILVSLATGISLEFIQKLSPEDITLFRSMPNTALAVGESITCLASRSASKAEKELIFGMFNCVGLAIEIQEEMFQAATVLGACGVAYALRFIRGLTQGGIEIGFSSKTAQEMAAQLLKGSAEILIRGDGHPEAEIDKVTTPQGCTIAGLNEMEHHGFTSSLIKGMLTSYNKINEMRPE